MKPILPYPEACFQVLTGRGRGSLSQLFRVKLLRQIVNDDDFLRRLVKEDYHIRATKKELNLFLPKIYKLKDIKRDKIAIELKNAKIKLAHKLLIHC